MPIFPRFESGVGVAAPNTPTPSGDSPGARLVAQAGQTLLNAASTINTIAVKRKALEDESMVLERYMQAVGEMDQAVEGLKGDAAITARESFEKVVSERSPTWYKGLSPEAAFKLETKLFGKTLEYRHGVARVENRAKADRYAAGLMSAEQVLHDKIGRGNIVGDPANSDEYKTYAEAIDVGVSIGFFDKEAGEKKKRDVLRNSALDVANRLLVDSPDVLLADLGQERTKGGSYLRHLDEGQRAQLKSAAQQRILTLQRQQEHDADRLRAERERYLAEQREYVQAEIERRLRSDRLTVEYLDTANSLRLVSGDDYKFYRNAIEDRLVQGGPGDPAVVRSLGLRVMSAEPSEARRLQAEVKEAANARKVPFNTALGWLQVLKSRESTEDAAPTLRQQSTQARNLVQEALRVTGPMSDQIDPIVQPILTEALEDLARNEAAGYPENPLALYHRKKAEWQGRARVPAIHRINELRRSMGLPSRLADKDDTIVLERQKLREEYDAATSQAEKDSILQRARRLKELFDLEEQVYRLTPAPAQSGQPPAPSTSAAPPPITGRRRQ